MINFNKRNFIIFLFIIIGLIVGIFTYQWWQIRGELAKQIEGKENIVKQLMESNKEVIKKGNFTECRLIEVIPSDAHINIYLLGAIDTEGENKWGMVFIHPEGFVVGSGCPYEGPGIGQMQMVYDVDGDGTQDMNFYIVDREIGDYLIVIIPGKENSPTDTYGLRLNNLVLAKDVPYSLNFLDRLYILRQTETGIIPIVPASVGCQF